MNRDFTFGPDRTICLLESEDGQYRITVARRPETGLEVFLELPVAVHVHRCGRVTRKGTPCQTRVAAAGLACHRHRQDGDTPQPSP